MIDLTVHDATRVGVAERARQRDIRIPTFAQMRDPGLVPEDVRAGLKEVILPARNEPHPMSKSL